VSVGVVLPYWLDRPDGEAVEIAAEADRLGFPTLWIGEMATFDAFALATAIGLRANGIALRVGPLAAGVRSPVALALGLSSVAALTGRRVDLALGASSPAIVSGWHDRPWAGAAPRMRETVRAVRDLVAGQRVDVDGDHVRAHGFRLRQPLPETTVTVAAFGPAMLRVAAEEADEVVLNLVTPEQVARVRAVVDAHAAKVDRPPPRLSVWVTAALEPGPDAIRQVSQQLALYLRAPGYAEMFVELGHGTLVAQAKSGVARKELAVPRSLLDAVCALGSAVEVRERIADYHRAGADHVGVAPSTADDPAGRRVLAAVV
jgi:probable F420-dependent oxidoreductase